MRGAETNLLDAHLHLQDEALSAQLAELLRRADGVGVRYFVSNGAEEADWPIVLAQARAHPQIIPCFGVHPWYVSNLSPQWHEKLAGHLDAIPSGIGEIGLDRWKEPRDEKVQEEAFRIQLDLARQRKLPVMIHCVRAWGWLMDVLRSEAPLPAGMLIHAYGGSADLIKPLAEMGAYFSYGGSTLDEHKKLRRETLPLIPRDRLLLETDAPDMPPPAPYRVRTLLNAQGKAINEPANLRPILSGIAELLREDEAQLAARVWENSTRFFRGLMPKAGGSQSLRTPAATGEK